MAAADGTGRGDGRAGADSELLPPKVTDEAGSNLISVPFPSGWSQAGTHSHSEQLFPFQLSPNHLQRPPPRM